MLLLKTDRPRPIDRLIDYFGESRPLLTAPSAPPPGGVRTQFIVRRATVTA
jgi:hypothetical protein